MCESDVGARADIKYVSDEVGWRRVRQDSGSPGAQTIKTNQQTRWRPQLTTTTTTTR